MKTIKPHMGKQVHRFCDVSGFR